MVDPEWIECVPILSFEMPNASLPIAPMALRRALVTCSDVTWRISPLDMYVEMVVCSVVPG